MKRRLTPIFILVSLVLSLFSISAPVAAVDLFKACTPAVSQAALAGPQTDVCKDVSTQVQNKKNPVISLMKIVLDILALIAGVSAVILIIINGLRLVVSNGDSNGVSSARTGLIYAIIGIAIVAVAQIIVVFVLDKAQ